MTPKTVYTARDARVLRYDPTAFMPFYVEMEPTTLLRRLRFLTERRYGRTVYYLRRDGTWIGYCAVSGGGNPRFWFASDGDIILGPYFTAPSYRGRGNAVLLADAVLHRCETGWRSAYVVIKNTNAASVAVTERLGGRLLFHVRNTRLKRFVRDERGDYGVYRIEGES